MSNSTEGDTLVMMGFICIFIGFIIGSYANGVRWESKLDAMEVKKVEYRGYYDKYYRLNKEAREGWEALVITSTNDKAELKECKSYSGVLDNRLNTVKLFNGSIIDMLKKP